MKNFKTIQEDTEKELSQWRYTIIAVILFALMIVFFVSILLNMEPKYDPDSEARILREAAEQLNKDVNDLTDEDFLKVTELVLSNRTLIDLRLLKKFTNLQVLVMNNIGFSKAKKRAKWKKFVEKLGIFNFPDKEIADLSIISKLQNLEVLILFEMHDFSDIKFLKGVTKLKHLELTGTPISDLEPIKELKNLEILKLNYTKVSSLEPIRELTNLKMLNLFSTQISDLEPIKGLKNLQMLQFEHSKVSNIEPLRGLTNLRACYINYEVSDIEPLKELTNLKLCYFGDTKIFSLEPIKNLTNLECLHMDKHENITYEQIENLQKALPNLRINKSDDWGKFFGYLRNPDWLEQLDKNSNPEAF